jgi:hypothetical protein
MALPQTSSPDERSWCDWTNNFVQCGSMGIRVNDDIGHYFQTRKGLC